MLSINMDDVINVINSIKTQLIVLAIVIIAVIIVMVAVRKLDKPLRRLVRGETIVALLLAVLIIVNSICTGPMSSMLDLVSTTSYLQEETTAEATNLVEEIADEGIVLLENDDEILPLSSDAKLNVFGWSSTNPCYGGTGSGALNDAYPTVTLLQGLANAGIETNEELTKFYTDYQEERPQVGMEEQDWTLPEPDTSLYTDELMDNAKEFSDTAMIVITRVGGEGADLPTDMMGVVNGTYTETTAMSYDDGLNKGNDWDEGDHFLELTNREEEMIDLVCSNFENVILVYNAANAFELGFIEEYPQIKGAVWCAGAGQSGFNALGSIVTGEVNPSGRLIDTYVYDMEKTPVWNNFGEFKYTNMDEFKGFSSISAGTESTPSFVNYVEGIYVGYKFYETAGDVGLINYDEVVQYPFGYGLSYSEFEQEMSEIREDGSSISFDVTVTNTGDTAGKDVVEVYSNPPYTEGGIEKATANLIEFAKTQLLEPGDSQTIPITIPIEELASYDTYGAGCYVLEKGDYEISVKSDSHTVIASRTYEVKDTITYDENGKRDSDSAAAVNQFQFAEGDVVYLSREDKFANYEEATAAPTDFVLADEPKKGFYNTSNYLAAEVTAQDEDPDAKPILTGQATDLKLKDVRGLDYDDPKWEELLDSMTLDEMNTLISLGGFQTSAVESIGKVRTNDNDGPASINNNFTGVGSVGFPAGVMVAATWSNELALKFGQSIGKMADEMDTTGWYAPAMNIHRSAFAGRNFEYYSEDGMLSGSIAANAVKGAEEYGVYAYMKHFVLNDQETHRNCMLCTWTNEQALREVYLKPFEICVKEGGCDAVMSSFNYIGNRWAGGCSQLLKNVLRGEWGFIGFVVTDYFGVYGYMSADQAVRNGTDMMLVNYAAETNDVRFRDTNGAQQAMRDAAHNILYVTANSRVYTDENYEKASATPVWRNILLGVNICVGIVLLALAVLLLKKYLDTKNKIAVEKEN